MDGRQTGEKVLLNHSTYDWPDIDTINHDQMLAKLKAYGFSTDALNLMHSYLKNRKEKIQINEKFGSEKDVIAGVPRGSIDRPLLFNSAFYLI